MDRVAKTSAPRPSAALHIVVEVSIQRIMIGMIKGGSVLVDDELYGAVIGTIDLGVNLSRGESGYKPL